MFWNEQTKKYEKTQEELDNPYVPPYRVLVVETKIHEKIMHLKHILNVKNQNEVIKKLIKKYEEG